LRVIQTVEQLQLAITNDGHNKKIVFVPTMGALHNGHLSLLSKSREIEDAFVILSIFVNPTQFGKNEDFDKYPRVLETDLELLESQTDKPDLVFAPGVDQVYPEGLPEQLVPRAGAVGSVFEGVTRPGHFDGMLHVVHWFFSVIKPDVAIFGEKDSQQLYLIRRMVKREFSDQIEIQAGQTVRDAHGLALSSRNSYLSTEARKIAPEIYRTLIKVQAELQAGENFEQALDKARLALSSLPLAKLDYLALVDKATFQPISAGFTGSAQLLVALNLDGVRLIDNITFSIQELA
jgi:pantoate--beta-alanine ligase